MFKGSIPALITPFKNGEIDWPSFENLVEWHIEQGSHGLVPCGTTGESPTLSHDEHMAITAKCAQVVNGRIPVIAGTGSNSTAEAIELTQHAKDAGADAALIVTPYYNKPTQDGMYAHFKAIHDEVDIPIVLYNIPGRSVVDLGVDAMARAPKQSAQMHEAWAAQDMDTFHSLRDALSLLATDLFCESNPAPVKYAASLLGKCRDEVRLPLLPASVDAQVKVRAAMEHAGLL